ncbi:MAG: hypothetical protein GC136_10450 [Alphaproteobacteria bacterium]|nr:hypothetical protein [Alphaproteobacteria bacterium]
MFVEKPRTPFRRVVAKAAFAATMGAVGGPKGALICGATAAFVTGLDELRYKIFYLDISKIPNAENIFKAMTEWKDFEHQIIDEGKTLKLKTSAKRLLPMINDAETWAAREIGISYESNISFTNFETYRNSYSCSVSPQSAPAFLKIYEKIGIKGGFYDSEKGELSFPVIKENIEAIMHAAVKQKSWELELRQQARLASVPQVFNLDLSDFHEATDLLQAIQNEEYPFVVSADGRTLKLQTIDGYLVPLVEKAKAAAAYELGMGGKSSCEYNAGAVSRDYYKTRMNATSAEIEQKFLAHIGISDVSYNAETGKLTWPLTQENLTCILRSALNYQKILTPRASAQATQAVEDDNALVSEAFGPIAYNF